MKALKFLVALCLYGSFAISSANAQAIVYEGESWWWNTGYNTYFTTLTHEVITPSGNHLIILYFQLDMEDPMVPDKGVFKFLNGGWEIFINVDGVALAKLQVNGKDKLP